MKTNYDIKELSLYLNISIPEIRKLVKEQRIPNFRIGKKIMFRIDSINAWLDDLEFKERRTSLFL